MEIKEQDSSWEWAGCGEGMREDKDRDDEAGVFGVQRERVVDEGRCKWEGMLCCERRVWGAEEREDEGCEEVVGECLSFPKSVE